MMFLRSASRSSATVLASTPARRAPLAADLAVELAALRAFCWRPRALPALLAAALRVDALREEAAFFDAALREDDDFADEARFADEALPRELLSEDAPPRDDFAFAPDDFDLLPLRLLPLCAIALSLSSSRRTIA
jgi:hypothetical protein